MAKLSRQIVWIQNSNLPQKTERHVPGTLLCLALKVKKSLGQNELCCIKAKEIVYRWAKQSVQIGAVSRKAKGWIVSLKLGQKSKWRFESSVTGKAKTWTWVKLEVNLYLYITASSPVGLFDIRWRR